MKEVQNIGLHRLKLHVEAAKNAKLAAGRGGGGVVGHPPNKIQSNQLKDIVDTCSQFDIRFSVERFKMILGIVEQLVGLAQ